MTFLLHHSIAKHASERPKAIAFRCRDESLTYHEIFEKSSQLANFLRNRGFKNGHRLGVFMGKDIHTPIATYGTLTAGGAYVPIDPNSKQSRLEFILNNCDIEFLVTTRSKIGLVKKIVENNNTSLRVIIGLAEDSIDSIETIPWETIARSSPIPPEIEIQENNLAYIMYTSGSTGTPKGLMHTHKSGLAYARHSAKLYQVSDTDILGNHAPLHFDISTFEFLTGPHVGATSVLIPEEELMFPNNLGKFIEREKLTFWYSVPLALIQMLTRSDLTEVNLSSLRWILFAGEPFPPEFLKDLMALIPNTQFSNIYGPAEVNQCTYFNIPRGDEFPQGPIPIGKIWDGAEGFIIDKNDIPVQPGETGELVVHTATMMANYWQRPDLDENAFYFKTSKSGDTKRYYRTGDFVLESNEGLLYFIGRRDRQIKIRGYRLELDEVESILTSYNTVEEAAVIAIRNKQDENELSAKVIMRPGTQFDQKSIAIHLQEKLPHYGVPKYLEEVSEFPRTASGKIDRIRLFVG